MLYISVKKIIYKRKFVYDRVGSKNQKSDRQIRTLKEYLDSEKKIFANKGSGKDTDYKNYQRVK